MPRLRFKRELCDCLDCTDPLRQIDAAERAVRHAAALQDPPPKCLVVYVDGALLPAPPSSDAAPFATSLDRAEHPHLDGCARDGCSGLLVVEALGAGVRQRLLHGTGSDRAPALDRLAQLFGLDAAARCKANKPPDIASRFKRLAAAFASTDSAAVELAGWAGFQRAVTLADLVAEQRDAQPALSGLPTPRGMATAALDLLGLGSSTQQPAATPAEDHGEEGNDVLDALLLHIAPEDGAAAAAREQFADACTRVEWLDALLQQLNARSGVREGLLLVLVLSSGGAPLVSSAQQPLLRQGLRHASGNSSLRPRQSWELRADQPVAVEAAAPLLVVQRLPTVVRVDACVRLCLKESSSHGGSGAILAERLLPELAYKLGRAPKYGA